MIRVIAIWLVCMCSGSSLWAEAPKGVLTSEQIEGFKASIPNWEVRDNRLERTVEFSSFVKLVEFVNQVTSIAESMNHHPDMDIRYKKLKFSLSTHDFNGVTALDIELARKIDAALAGL